MKIDQPDIEKNIGKEADKWAVDAQAPEGGPVHKPYEWEKGKEPDYPEAPIGKMVGKGQIKQKNREGNAAGLKDNAPGKWAPDSLLFYGLGLA